MSRRVHVEKVEAGVVALGAEEAHHVRTVLRMRAGDAVEVFDDGGRVGTGVIRSADGNAVEVEVERVEEAGRIGVRLTIAAAVPKGPRVDWMVEKLSELGVDRFVPLAARRSVVVPEGTSKMQRWARIAQEAAKQSRRAGVMAIDAVHDLPAAVAACAAEGARGMVATTQGSAVVPALGGAQTAWIFIGPEGGWDDAELALMADKGLTRITLGPTILRIETAAVAAAAVVAALASPADPTQTP